MTTHARPWGLLVAASLPALGACSAAPPAVTPPVPDAVAPAPPPAAPEATVLGPFVPLSADEVLLAPSTRALFNLGQKRVFFGRGSLLVREAPRWDRAPSNCPILETKDVCAAYTLTVTDQDPADESWRTGEAPSKAVTRTLIAPLPSAWLSLVGGRDRVYALTAGTPGVIDQIDDKGTVTPLAESDRMSEWERFQVVELGERRIVVGHEDTEPITISELVPGDAGKPMRLGPPTKLDVIPVSRHRRNAQAAREIEARKSRPLYGPLVAIPTRDETSGKGGGWALVWVEALPPPFDWPAGKDYTRKGRHQCGGPSSRALSVKSVEKRVHVTRFEGTKQVSDKVVLSTGAFDAEDSPFLVRPTDKGIEINGVTYDKNGKSVETRTVKTAALASEPMAPDELVVATAFDAARGEGAVVYWSGDKARWRRFDGQGKPRGASVVIAGDPAVGYNLYSWGPILASPAGHWWLTALNGDQVLSLERNLLLPGPPERSDRFFAALDAPIQIEMHDRAMAARRFDPVSGAFADKTETLQSVWGEYVSFQIVKGSGPASSFVAVPRTDEGEPRALVRYEPAADRWVELPGSLPASLGTIQSLTTHEVWGDLVVRVVGSEGTGFHWVKGAGTRVYPKKETQGHAVVEKEMARGYLRGPLLDEGARMLPSKPGPLIETPELEGIGGRCEQTLPTAPGTLTMVCAEAVYKDKPGVRVGMQTYHFHE